MTIVWHRADLRVHDHPALAAAGEHAIGVVILDKNILDATTPRRRAWFVRNVETLRKEYEKRGGMLCVRSGVPWDELRLFCKETSASIIFALSSYTPYGKHRDQMAERQGIPITWFPGCYVHEPGTVKSSSRYSVFTPFFKKWSSLTLPSPVPPPSRLHRYDIDPGDIPNEPTDISLPEPGEHHALTRCKEFLTNELAHYADHRDRLDGSGSSQLSPYITVGSISVRAIARESAKHGEAANKFLSELAWRDFMADLLDQRPDMLDTPFSPLWSAMPWIEDENAFEAWRIGRTGFPLIDAAMRQLNATGWISNRARMNAAQFLTKHMMLPWTWGEQLFRDLLIDGDRAQNAGNWQWAAGLGVDAAPYFRVFNPVIQAAQHDPDGTWLRAWCPESNGKPDPLPNAILDIRAARARYLNVAKSILNLAEPTNP